MSVVAQIGSAILQISTLVMACEFVDQEMPYATGFVRVGIAGQ